LGIREEANAPAGAGRRLHGGQHHREHHRDDGDDREGEQRLAVQPLADSKRQVAVR
jgi:hypothetical protein